MKKLIPFIIVVFFTTFLLNSCFKANDNVEHDGRCSGSAYCTACTNCSRCGHCSGGGTCGVCGGGSSGKGFSGTSSKRSKLKKSKTSFPSNYQSNNTKAGKSSKAPAVFTNETNSSRYIIGIAKTNIYEKPSIKSKIIETIPKNEKLIQISKQNSWYKVQIKKSGKIGYILSKNVTSN